MMTWSKNNIDSIFSLLRKMAQVHLERRRRDKNSSRPEDIETVSSNLGAESLEQAIILFSLSPSLFLCLPLSVSLYLSLR